MGTCVSKNAKKKEANTEEKPVGKINFDNMKYV